MTASGSRECCRPRTWPNSWAATCRRSVPSQRRRPSRDQTSFSHTNVNSPRHLTDAVANRPVFVVVKVDLSLFQRVREKSVGQNSSRTVEREVVTMPVPTKRQLISSSDQYKPVQAVSVSAVIQKTIGCRNNGHHAATSYKNPFLPLGL